MTDMIETATFRFYEELNDFLPRQRRKSEVAVRIAAYAPVKDTIEALGVPHTEVDLILVNGESVGFSHVVEAGDRVSVYPVFEAFDITPLNRLRPRPLRRTRFVLDAHLGRLARYLRLLGFDSRYDNTATDAEPACIPASRAGRILLTRDRGLLKRPMVTHGYVVRETDPKMQLREVLSRFQLHGAIRPFPRCMHCNTRLREAGSDDVPDRVPAHIRRRSGEFSCCPACRRVYRKGSHYHRLRDLLQRFALTASAQPGNVRQQLDPTQISGKYGGP